MIPQGLWRASWLPGQSPQVSLRYPRLPSWVALPQHPATGGGSQAHGTEAWGGHPVTVAALPSCGLQPSALAPRLPLTAVFHNQPHIRAFQHTPQSDRRHWLPSSPRSHRQPRTCPLLSGGRPPNRKGQGLTTCLVASKPKPGGLSLAVAMPGSAARVCFRHGLRCPRGTKTEMVSKRHVSPLV